MPRPIIGISSEEMTPKYEPWGPNINGQATTYVDAVIRAGGAPILLPLANDKELRRQLYDMCDGILLTGGNDIDPDVYGEKKHEKTVGLSPKRDDQELHYIEWATEDDKPLFGICRGMQLINIARGGSLYQDIASQVPEAGNHEISTEKKDMYHLAHRLNIDPTSRFSSIVGDAPIGTNAHHHQAVKDLGDGLVAVAWAEDGIIEAFELPTKHFFIAVQSHPESLDDGAEPRWQKLFKAFVESSSR